jgi:hypothetical protein
VTRLLKYGGFLNRRNNMETAWTTHAEFLVLLITLLGGFYLLDGKIERQVDRSDRIFEAHAARTDKLYEMFIDIVKEKKRN